MERIRFKDIEGMADYMNYAAINYLTYVVAVLFYDEATKLLQELMLYDNVKPISIHIEPEDWDGYDKEYFITLARDQFDKEMLNLYVEPAFNFGKYLGTDADLLLIDGDANALLLTTILNHDFCDVREENCKEISFGTLDDDCDCEIEYYGYLDDDFLDDDFDISSLEEDKKRFIDYLHLFYDIFKTE